MSHFSFNSNVILLSGFGLLDGFSLSEGLFASFLWGNNLGVIQVDLVDTIVNLGAVELTEYVLAKLVE